MKFPYTAEYQVQVKLSKNEGKIIDFFDLKSERCTNGDTIYSLNSHKDSYIKNNFDKNKTMIELIIWSRKKKKLYPIAVLKIFSTSKNTYWFQQARSNTENLATLDHFAPNLIDICRYTNKTSPWSSLVWVVPKKLDASRTEMACSYWLQETERGNCKWQLLPVIYF